MQGTPTSCLEAIRIKLAGTKALACLLDVAHTSGGFPDDQHWDATVLLTTLIDESMSLIEDLGTDARGSR